MEVAGWACVRCLGSSSLKLVEFGRHVSLTGPRGGALSSPVSTIPSDVADRFMQSRVSQPTKEAARQQIRFAPQRRWGGLIRAPTDPIKCDLCVGLTSNEPKQVTPFHSIRADMVIKPEARRISNLIPKPVGDP